jgi:NADPH:quinone reductase-like Zn-dependent oxidoreductase
MATMKAITVHEFGGPEVLKYEDAPRPEPGAGEALVRVRAAAVNPIDWKVRAGYLKDYVKYELPMTPGIDFSGTIEKLGPGASGFAIGDDVYSQTDFSKRFGTYADYITTDASRLARKPALIDHAHAAAAPVAGAAAWHSFFGDGMADLKAGQTVLIHAAAGGVGTFAVQFAQWRGAKVIGTGSERSREFLTQLGVDEFVDYTSQPFETVVHDVDVVLDTLGDETIARSWRVLKAGGALASVAGQNVTPPADAPAGVRGFSVMGSASIPELGRIADLIDKGLIKPAVTEILPLANAAKAHEISQSGHARGKIVLVTE